MQRIAAGVVSQPKNGFYAMKWTPGMATLARSKPRLGQKALFEDPKVALLTDVIAAGSMGYLSILLTRATNNWSILTWALTAGVLVKGLHDMSRL